MTHWLLRKLAGALLLVLAPLAILLLGLNYLYDKATGKPTK